MLKTTCFSGRHMELKQLRLCSVPVVNRQQMQRSLTHHTLKAHRLWRAVRRQLKANCQHTGAANACIAFQAAAAATCRCRACPALLQRCLPAGLNKAKLLEQNHQQCDVWQFAVITERQLASSGLLAVLVSAICLQLAMPGSSSAAETPLPIEAFKSFLVSLPDHAVRHSACKHPGRWPVCAVEVAMHAPCTDRLDGHSTAVTTACVALMHGLDVHVTVRGLPDSGV